ncbi:MAG TPA: YceI family protein [Myxococcaceae bacterium]|nr:YceI family protein [Myxococcaceae bacterium]
MRRRARSFIAAAAVVVTLPGYALAAEYVIDPAHSNAMFAVRHLMVATVRGEFGKVQGTLTLDEKDITKSTVTATIDTASIDTDEPKRDDHLRSADFFDAQKYPAITFKSTKVQKAKNGLKVTGDLTIRDVTKPVVLEVEGPTKPIKDPMGTTKIGASATTKINRQDYGLKWNRPLEAGGVVVGDEVRITLDLEFNQKKSDQAAAVEKK